MSEISVEYIANEGTIKYKLYTPPPPLKKNNNLIRRTIISPMINVKNPSRLNVSYSSTYAEVVQWFYETVNAISIDSYTK